FRPRDGADARRRERVLARVHPEEIARPGLAHRIVAADPVARLHDLIALPHRADRVAAAHPIAERLGATERVHELRELAFPKRAHRRALERGGLLERLAEELLHALCDAQLGRELAQIRELREEDGVGDEEAAG